MDDTPKRASVATRRDHLDRVASQLPGFDRELSVSRTGVPMLIVTNPDVPAMAEHILCCHDVDGSLAFCWPWGGRVGGVDDPAGAAVEVARVLG